MESSHPDNPMHDAEIVRRAAQGDRAAQRELFDAHREAAYRVAFRIVQREHDALDVVQDAFIRAFEGLAGFQHASGFRTWLLRIVNNRALDLLRARRVRVAVPIDPGADENAAGLDLPAPEVNPLGGVESEELGVRLRAAIGALPPEQRTVFSLYAEGAYTYAEIAEMLGIPIGTVMSRLFHARKKLQSALSDVSGAKESE